MADKRRWKIVTESFEFFYSSGENIITDSATWRSLTHSLTKNQSQQNASSVRSIWREIDDKLTTIPNKLREGDKIDDYWFTPNLQEVKRQEKLPPDKRTPHLSAPTLLAKLGNISLFLKFLQARNIYVRMSLKDMMVLNVKIQEMSKRLKKHCDQRKTDIKSFKSQTMLIPNDCIEYNKSTHVREIVVLIERLQRYPGYPATKTSNKNKKLSSLCVWLIKRT